MMTQAKEGARGGDEGADSDGIIIAKGIVEACVREAFSLFLSPYEINGQLSGDVARILVTELLTFRSYLFQSVSRGFSSCCLVELLHPESGIFSPFCNGTSYEWRRLTQGKSCRCRLCIFV